MKVVKSALGTCRFKPPPPQGRFFVLISVWGWVDTRSIMRPKGLCHWKIPVMLLDHIRVIIANKSVVTIAQDPYFNWQTSLVNAVIPPRVWAVGEWPTIIGHVSRQEITSFSRRSLCYRQRNSISVSGLDGVGWSVVSFTRRPLASREITPVLTGQAGWVLQSVSTLWRWENSDAAGNPCPDRSARSVVAIPATDICQIK